MIFALEGPNCCGKTSVYNALLMDYIWPDGVRFVGIPDAELALMPVMHLVEQRHAKVWEALYEPKILYICDRHFSVSSKVYGALYGRPMLMDVTKWLHHVHVHYMVTSAEELKRRHTVVGEKFPVEKYEETILLYESVCALFNRVTYHSGTVDKIAESIYKGAMGWLGL